MTALAYEVVRADPERRRSLQGGAMGVQVWPVYHRLARAAVPSGVSAAAVAEAGDMPDENLIRAEGMSVGAFARWLGHPFTVGGLDERTLVHASNLVLTTDGSARHSAWLAGRRATDVSAARC